MEPLATLFDESTGEALPLPAELVRLYGGPLRIPAPSDRPHVYANFVASIDGIVAIDPPHGTGADISEGDARDRALMGLLRAAADAVVVGGGNLRAEGDHVWTADRICPELAAPFARLREALGKPPAPLQIVVTGSGDVDPTRAVFSGVAPAVVVTTPAGAVRLRTAASVPPIAVAEPVAGWIPLALALRAAGIGPGARVLLESGPHSTARYVAEGAVDELFLTRAPILVGRGSARATLGLVDGRVFDPWSVRARLLSARRGRDFLFLRYAIGSPAE